MVVKICVGSSCHLKNSYGVIEELKKLVKARNLENQIELQASFCLGHCESGVAIDCDDTIIHGLNENNVEEVFQNQILPLVK